MNSTTLVFLLCCCLYDSIMHHDSPCIMINDKHFVWNHRQQILLLSYNTTANFSNHYSLWLNTHTNIVTQSSMYHPVLHLNEHSQKHFMSAVIDILQYMSDSYIACCEINVHIIIRWSVYQKFQWEYCML